MPTCEGQFKFSGGPGHINRIAFGEHEGLTLQLLLQKPEGAQAEQVGFCFYYSADGTEVNVVVGVFVDVGVGYPKADVVALYPF